MIIFFDGTCKLCNQYVNLIIKLDKESKFKFAHLESETGKQHRNIASIPAEIDTVILKKNNRFYTKSDAFFEIIKELPYLKCLGFLRVFPLKLKDFIYDFIATNRHKWFGEQDSCLMPSAELKNRFLD